MSENQKQAPNAVDLMSTMVENQKSMANSQEIMAKNQETMVEAIKQQGEQFKSFLESQAETKSAKDAMESMKKEIEENVEAKFKEVKAKNPVYTGGVTQVENPEQLEYQVKSNTITALTKNVDGLEMEAMYNQGLAYMQSFCKKHNNIAQRYELSNIIGELSAKSISHTITDMSALFNAPFILPAIVYAEQEMVMQRIATVYSSNSRTVLKNSFTGEGEPEWIGLKPQIDPQKATVYTLQQIQAAGLGRYVTIAENVTDAASLQMPQIMQILQSFMREQIMTKFETAYSANGITIGDAGGTIEGIIPSENNQYAYDFNNSIGSDQLVVGKLAFVKSGNLTDFTYDSAIKMEGTLPEGTRLQFMGNSKMIDKFKNLKDPATNRIIYFDGNGAAIINGLPKKQLGFELIVNNKMADNIAVYGDITGSYAITNCFGGYKVFNRPAVGGQLFDGLMAKMYATGQITNYKKIRLYKIGS